MNLDAHYRVLGLQPGSPLALVKKAYLREIKTWHPDRYAPDSSLREMAEERAKALTAAYAVLRAALEDPRSDGAHIDAAKGRREASAPAPHTGPTGRPWFERLWQYLRLPRQVRPAMAGPASAERRSGKRAVTGEVGRRKATAFNQILDEARGRARGRAKSPAGSAAAWRRLAARRARYRYRRGRAGATAVDPIRPRGPVTPVRPVRPIGEDG